MIAWKLGGDYLRGTVAIWMDGRAEPSPNSLSSAEGFTTGKWEGDTLTARTTHVKTAWIRRGNGIPGSDQSTFTIHLTRHENLLTIVTIQEDPIYLTEPHVVSRVWQLDPRATPGNYVETNCNTANEVPRLEDSGIVPHYLPGKNPEADFMMRTYNLPKEAAMGVRGKPVSGVPQEDQERLRAAGVLRTVLLRMDRAPGPAGRSARSLVQRRRPRRAEPGRAQQAGGTSEVNVRVNFATAVDLPCRESDPIPPHREAS